MARGDVKRSLSRLRLARRRRRFVLVVGVVVGVGVRVVVVVVVIVGRSGRRAVPRERDLQQRLERRECEQEQEPRSRGQTRDAAARAAP